MTCTVWQMLALQQVSKIRSVRILIFTLSCRKQQVSLKAQVLS